MPDGSGFTIPTVLIDGQPLESGFMLLGIDVTRAVMVASPVMFWYTKWNSSAVPQISAPLPRTVNVVASDAVAVPAAPRAGRDTGRMPGRGIHS